MAICSIRGCTCKGTALEPGVTLLLFLFPWDSILVELQRIEEDHIEKNISPDLPRTGRDLQYAVQVLLKTNDEDKRDALRNFIFQAHVNRDSCEVHPCNEEKRPQSVHNIDEAAVREKAQKLPQHGTRRVIHAFAKRQRH